MNKIDPKELRNKSNEALNLCKFLDIMATSDTITYEDMFIALRNVCDIKLKKLKTNV